jgi:hypothetical protein
MASRCCMSARILRAARRRLGWLRLRGRLRGLGVSVRPETGRLYSPAILAGSSFPRSLRLGGPLGQ